MSQDSEPSRLRNESSATAINPYQSSFLSAEMASPSMAPDSSDSGAGERQYRIRMEWCTRRRFLRLALPLRVGAIAGGVMVLYGFYGLGTAIHNAWVEGIISSSQDIPWVLQFLFTPVRSVIIVWMCWLYWKLADAMVATAGGSTSSMEEWSRIQHRLVWSMIAVLVIGVLSIGWDWLIPRLLVPIGIAD